MYTLEDQNDFDNILRRWIYQPKNIDHAMI